MELKIEIDETRFKDVVEQELKAFSKEELHTIIREGIVKYLNDSDLIKRLFVEERYDSFWNKCTEYPTQLLKSAVETFDLSPAYEEIKDNMISNLKTNYNELLIQVMTGMLAKGIRQTLMSSGEFESMIRDITLNTFNSLNHRN